MLIFGIHSVKLLLVILINNNKKIQFDSNNWLLSYSQINICFNQILFV